MSTPPGSRGEGRRDPDTGGRPLADILREAGVESPTRGRRRRGDELEDTGVRQRGTGDTGRVADRAEFGRRASDRAGDAAPATPAPTGGPDAGRSSPRPRPSPACGPPASPASRVQPPRRGRRGTGPNGRGAPVRRRPATEG
ncbi:MAG: hypothetical protein M3Q47_15225, partial [Actinomycetota bacterium]|nr:hypothetical protein [Actinomycetota bacterium]